MAIIETTSRQFREKQKDFFDLADIGEKIVIKRGKKQAYVLTPLDNNHLYFTPDMINRIKESEQEIIDGKGITFNTADELDKYIQSM